jgi:hypothetical protein
VTSAFKKLHFPGEKVVLTSGEPLSQFLTTSGQQFGKDASKWYQVGESTSNDFMQPENACIGCFMLHK